MNNKFSFKLWYARKWLKLVSKIEGKEEIYTYSYGPGCKYGDYIVFVNDEEVGKRIYPIIKKAKDTMFNFFYNEWEFFRITSYEATLGKSIKWYRVTTRRIRMSLNRLETQFEGLIELETIRLCLKEHLGFRLDTRCFDYSKCKCISEFLSCFYDANSTIREKSPSDENGCMLNYIHYILTGGGDLKEYYKSIDDNQVLIEHDSLPYKLPLVQICYEYYKTGKIVENDDVPNRIYQALINGPDYMVGEKATESLEKKYIFAIPENVSKKLKIVEETAEYTIYEGNVKIYKNISTQIQAFLKVYFDTIKSRSRKMIEQLKRLILDIDGNIIGYQFTIGQTSPKAKKNLCSINDIKFDYQRNVFDFLTVLLDFYEKTIPFRYEIPISEFALDGESYDIEKTVICKCENVGLIQKKYSFYLRSVEEFYEINSKSMSEKIKYAIIKKFFEVMCKYITNRYGDKEGLSRQEIIARLHEKVEIRYLNPYLIERIKEYFENVSMSSRIYEETWLHLVEFLRTKKLSDNGEFYFDEQYGYDPTKVNIIFTDEVAKKYFTSGVLRSTTNPDGSKICIVNSKTSVKDFVDNNTKLKASVEKELGNIIDEKMRYIEPIAIIVKKENNTLYVRGYVTEPIRGKFVSLKELKKLSNKDLMKVAAYFFSKFKNKYFSKVWMDEEFNFFVEYLEAGTNNPSIVSLKNGYENNYEFVEYVFKYLFDKGYNPYAFVGIKVPQYNGEKLKQYFLKLADSMNAYCEKHDVHYNSQDGLCPVCKEIMYIVADDFTKTHSKVFEDEIATHYNIDEQYNLKLYKPLCDGHIQAIETSVRGIISKNLTSIKVYLHQDCFIPCKVALNNEGKFIGCVYKREKFESEQVEGNDVCIDLANTEKLINLPRLKSLVRFGSQIEQLVFEKKCCVINAFTHVFLNTTHKKQVQILNIELMGNSEIKDATNMHNWAYEYILKILKSDPTIEFDETKCLKTFGNILFKVRCLVNELKKYCPVHKKYYDKDYAYCPECVDLKMQKEYISFEKDDTFVDDTPINEGGESFIYMDSKNSVVKVFKETEVNMEFKTSVLFRILTKLKILKELNKEEKSYTYVVPKEILFGIGSKKLLGYRMDRVKDAYPIANLKDKNQIKELGFTKKDVFEILIAIGEGIETLHNRANIYIGDLNGRNILFDKKKRVYFLDFDGMGVDEIMPEFCTDGYIDPVSKNNHCITQKDDWYSFAIQAFYYLTYTHPFNGVYYEKNGNNKVLLEIPDKMEKRISLLGNHGMNPPEIALSWEWMDKELQDSFLKIFEGDLRESIVPLLKKQYQKLSKSIEDSALGNIYRINSKFYAIEFNNFKWKVVKVFKPNVAICIDDTGNEVVTIAVQKGENDYKTYVLSGFKLENVIGINISNDNTLAFVTFKNGEVRVFDVISNRKVYSLAIPEAKFVLYEDDALYYSEKVNLDYILRRVKLDAEFNPIVEDIEIDNKELICLDVINNSKFVFIKCYSLEEDEVYCNQEKFHSFKYDAETDKYEHQYQIMYDEKTKSWAIINNYGQVVIICADAQKIELDISNFMANRGTFSECITYDNWHLYISGQNKLSIVNVKTSVKKIMQCENIMTPETVVYDINSKGFSIYNENLFYKIRRG